MSLFDASEYAGAFTPPSVVLGGRTHVGVLLSADEWFAIAPRLAAAGETADRALMRALVRDMTDACFPRPWWRVWTPRVSALLLRLPWGAQIEALGSFTVAQAVVQAGRPGRTTETNGTPSDA